MGFGKASWLKNSLFRGNISVFAVSGAFTNVGDTGGYFANWVLGASRLTFNLEERERREKSRDISIL